MFQEVETVLLSDHLNTDFTKPSRVVVFLLLFLNLSFIEIKEHFSVTSFMIDWFDLLAFQGIFKSLLQHHNSKASILQHSVFFMVHLSHPYTAPGKNIALTRWTFVGKVMSMLFNTLSRFVTDFLPRSKHLLILCLQSLSIVILEPKREYLSQFLLFPHQFAIK